MFDNPSKAIVGLERLMLEASGFDYRGRCPQKVLVKLVKAYDFDAATIGQTAYQMCIDLYRTFAPLKQTAATLAFACIELSARLHEPESFSQLQPAALEQWSVQRDEVMGTLRLVPRFSTPIRSFDDLDLESWLSILVCLS